MSCCEPWPANPEDSVGQCPDCQSDVDKHGECTEEGCGYSPIACDTCGWKPCDQSC